jgi:hypothetical protein
MTAEWTVIATGGLTERELEVAYEFLVEEGHDGPCCVDGRCIEERAWQLREE